MTHSSNGCKDYRGQIGHRASGVAVHGVADGCREIFTAGTGVAVGGIN